MEIFGKRDFQLLKMRKKLKLEHKNQVRNRRYLESWVLEYEILYLILCVEQLNVKGLPKFQLKKEVIFFN